MERSLTMCLLVFASTLLLDPQVAFTNVDGNQSQEEKKQDTTGENKTESTGESKKAEKKTATTSLRVEVADLSTSAPIVGASVYVRIEQDGKVFQKEPRTDKSGVVRIPGVPRGNVLIQVQADGWIRDGQNYALNKGEETIIVKLKKEK